MIQIPKFIKDTLKYFQYEGSPNPTTQDDLQAFMKSDHSVLECLVDGLWQPETYYKENHVVRSPNMQAGFVAKVTKAGTSGSNEPDWGGATASDGTVEWKVQKQGSGSGGASWEASTFYSTDSTVSLEGKSSFFLLCTKSGTSGAIEPTVSGENNVTDGSVTWKPIYYKKLPVLDNSNYVKGENLAGYWKASELVQIGTVRYLQGDKYAGYYLKCIYAGTTGSTQPKPSISTASAISDGTAKWQLQNSIGLAGEIKMYSGNEVPTGWLLCDGSAISRSTYSVLFAVIGTKYGKGNGSTTFNLPDLSDSSLGGIPKVTGNSSTVPVTMYGKFNSGYNGGTVTASGSPASSYTGAKLTIAGTSETSGTVGWRFNSNDVASSLTGSYSGSVEIKYIIKY